MSIFDAIKNSVLENFDTTLTSMDIIAGLAVALAAGLFILLVYRLTMPQVSFDRSFCTTLLLVSAISAMMVLTITSNLALSLGMVGALSIVRFRSAIKDVADTAYLFWAVAAGITAGAGYFLLTLIGCVSIGLICVVSMLLFALMSKPFLLVIRTEQAEDMEQAEDILRSSGMRHRVSALTEGVTYTEGIYEVAFTKKHRNTLIQLKSLEGVTHVSLVDCRKR